MMDKVDLGLWTVVVVGIDGGWFDLEQLHGLVDATVGGTITETGDCRKICRKLSKKSIFWIGLWVGVVPETTETCQTCPVPQPLV